MSWIVHKYLYNSIVACKQQQQGIYLYKAHSLYLLYCCVPSFVCVSPPRADLEEN